MLKTCTECERLYSGEGNLCKRCLEKDNAKNKLGECKSCGIITKNRVEGYCFKCAISFVDNFKVARTYLYLNPRVTIADLSEATGISQGEISSYIRNGKLEVLEGIENNNDSKICVDCGEEIERGNTCSSCKRNREALKKLKQQRIEKRTNNNEEVKSGFYSKR